MMFFLKSNKNEFSNESTSSARVPTDIPGGRAYRDRRRPPTSDQSCTAAHTCPGHNEPESQHNRA